MSAWKDRFRKQVDCGKYWKNLYQEDFDKHKFLERSDAESICKRGLMNL
jgi:hypothetical protein